MIFKNCTIDGDLIVRQWFLAYFRPAAVSETGSIEKQGY
jgi:hypothetical protein